MLLQCGSDYFGDILWREGSKETVETELVHVRKTVRGWNAQCENLLEDRDLALREVSKGTERQSPGSSEGQKSTKWLMYLSTRNEERIEAARGRLGTRSLEIISQIEPMMKTK